MQTKLGSDGSIDHESSQIPGFAFTFTYYRSRGSHINIILSFPGLILSSQLAIFEMLIQQCPAFPCAGGHRKSAGCSHDDKG